uniref:Uncharacterized protein n=1 Tax=Oryza sativa subsp. japonica TaxID=39947 RepID=Q8LMX5_ORYSJ|nr:hypothetical protein [Oryza sativa Japonica Group]
MEADPVCQPRRVADKRTPLDTTRRTTTDTDTRIPGLTTAQRARATPKGRGRGSERRDPYHHATRRGNDNDERARRRRPGTTETNGEGTTSAAILGRRRDAAGATLDDAEPRTKTTTTGAGEEATRAAGSSCTETGTTWNAPLRIRRRRRRRETTSRATDGTSTTRTNRGDDDGPRRGLDGGEAMPRTTLPLRCQRWRRRRRPAHWHGGRGCRSGCRQDRGRGGAGDGVPAKPRAGRGGGRRRDVDEGDGDIGRRSDAATGATDGGTVAATPLFCRRRRVSGDFPAKRRRSRGRGGSCDVADGDGTAGRHTGAAAGAAGDGRRHRREGKVMGRWLGARERAKWTKGRRRASFYRARTECRSRERPKMAPEEVAGGINGGQRRGIKSR